jgi:membrane-associated phospholipid phosphatase
MISRRLFLGSTIALALGNTPLQAGLGRPTAQEVVQRWYGLTLELVRHTATYSPPVASRTFAYLGIVILEAVASGGGGLQSLAGQLPGLKPLPQRAAGAAYDLPNLVHGALIAAIEPLFSHTGPTGQRAIKATARKLEGELALGVSPSRVKRSRSFGIAIAQHVLAWSQDDGGATIDNMGFPQSFKPVDKAGAWVPTSVIRMQQAPLLPTWGENRTFVLANGGACPLPPPPTYSEDKTSEFYKQALEVYDTVKNLSQEQRLIARFWSDDPMLSPTPPGHWMFIALDILKDRSASIEDHADLLARLGMAVSDGFVACWKAKFAYNLLRPVTYIKKLIDKTWEPILITPPFPEYPSGHSTQSGAAATVLTQFFGENFKFDDKTHVREKLPVRSFASFWDAANEAGISRLYGGIHFRAALEQGLEQGRCVGAAVNALKTRRTA